ncbi:hypothetical protein CC86DRAFT_285495 [Ophiobolus disseminans]|uniref:Uncharacterized protein n=1 Tax=Ophiobolus disseminans TaxID=1469910 RepID=A0A6A7AC13_9PLEO|nr:hypothetical protein CC86DRAFT_285495 [Ophiobolus disseminans]
MLLFSHPRCHPSTGAGQETTFTSPALSLPLWPTRPSLVALRSLQQLIRPQPTSRPKSRKSQRATSTTTMSSPRTHSYGSPRSPLYSPTLNTIPEVFEYEPLEVTSLPTTPHETHDSVTFVLPEPATTAVPAVSRGPKTKGIITSPRKARTVQASTRIANVLRNVLEADRLRRRRALRIYLKAIVFLKMLLKSHERYGTLMATQGAYMQR